MGLGTNAGKSLTKAAVVVFDVCWVDAPPLNGLDGLVGSTFVIFSAVPTGIELVLGSVLTTLPSGLNTNS
jgi:hypothetical protein